MLQGSTQGTQGTQTKGHKKLHKNGRSKMSSKQARPKDGVLPISMLTPREKNLLYNQEYALPSETRSSIPEYIPKIPHVTRPFREYNSPERVPHSTRTPHEERSHVSSPKREYNIPASERNFNLSTLITNELPRRPISSLSPMRYLFLLLEGYATKM